MIYFRNDIRPLPSIRPKYLHDFFLDDDDDDEEEVGEDYDDGDDEEEEENYDDNQSLKTTLLSGRLA